MSKNFSFGDIFHDWDKTCSVRSRPKRVLLPEHIGDNYFFSPETAPFLEHPLLSKLCDNETSTILIRQLYSYLNFTQYLEHEAICVVSYSIAMQAYDFDIPHALCADARKIYVDEIYHWMFSIDFAEETEALTGVKNLCVGEPYFLKALKELTAELTDQQKHLALLFFTTIAETLITPTMSKFPNDERLVLPVRELIGDHCVDELRHLKYFIELFHLIWEQIDPSDRRILCLLLPKMLYCYFAPDFNWITLSLKSLGISEESTQKILSDTYPKDKVVENVMASSVATIKLFRDVGMFEDDEVRAAFYEEGLKI